MPLKVKTAVMMKLICVAILANILGASSLNISLTSDNEVSLIPTLENLSYKKINPELNIAIKNLPENLSITNCA